MKKRRLLAWLMTLVMMVGLMPATALAEESGPTKTVTNASDSAVKITKSVGDPVNGKYPITIDAYATGTVQTTNPNPLDIVLVLDVSGSMDEILSYTAAGNKTWTASDVSGNTKYYYKHTDNQYYEVWTRNNKLYVGSRTELGTTYNGTLYTGETKLAALKTAVNNFIGAVAENSRLYENVEHRISIVKFATDSSQVTNGLLAVEANEATLKSYVNALSAGGATRADLGMSTANTVLTDRTNGTGRDKVVVMFTDGVPTSYRSFEASVARDAINTAGSMKDNSTTIFTIGVLEGADPADTTANINKYMNAVSSNYPDATASGRSELTVDLDGNDGVAGGNNGYYKVASDAAGLNSVFGQIAESIQPSITLGTTTVLKDVVSPMFAPEGITTNADGGVTSGVTVYKVPAGGTGSDPTGAQLQISQVAQP